MNPRRLTLKCFALVLLLLPSLCSDARARQTTPASSDNARVERLVGLAKLWAAAKYFHPYLAYREVDWDKALVEAIPKVQAAKTPHEYSAALNQMLAVLGDAGTRAEIVKDAPSNQTPATAPVGELVRTEGGVLVIDVMRLADVGARDNTAFRVQLGKIGEAADSAKAVVIDARRAAAADDFAAYFLADILRQTLPQFLDSDVTLGSTRYRLHNGYATQSGGASFYYSAFANLAPQTLAGRNKTKAPSVVFIVNEHTPSAADTLSGLRHAGRAFVVQEGERAPEAGGGAATLELPEGVRARLRTSESVNPDGSLGFNADAVVAKVAGEDAAMREAMRAAQEGRVSQAGRKTGGTVAPLVGQKEKTYAEMEFPSAEYRLLALFRYWAVVNYFYPYRHLIEDTWATVLPRYIPKFEANKDAVDYQLTVRELVTEMHDSHGGVQNANASAERLGTFLPPVVVRYVENKSVVTHVLDDKLPVKVGDVVLTVDGETVEKRVEFLSRYTAASTPQALMRSVHANLLRGQKGTVAKLRVRSTDGATREVELPRSFGNADRAKLFAATQRSTPVVQVLPSGYGYVDLARLQVGEVDKMFETVKNTPALIFDMRGYPNGTAWAVAPRLTEKSQPVAALFSRPLLEAPAIRDTEIGGSVNYTFSQKIPERRGDVYGGKVVMLINEDAISQSEHTCMFFEAATDVTFVGTPTTGANGDVTYMVLPGNLAVSFTGHDVRHADGRQLQRIGIQPHVKAAPTVGGVAAGRDEILEAAVKHLQESLKK
ncbi:MAG TPA: S41 family peptidase [Pyrinomonadaceae bacterium]